MKLALTALLLCLVFAKDLSHKNGKEVLEALQGNNNEVYVVLFHAGSKSKAVQEKANEYRSALSGI